jgi:hypothetical protein
MKLTKQQIIRTIRRLHRQGEPLNISAVKRRHPELMKAVYAVKPFWGWKRALEAAEINYSDIKVELLDYCECEICHARMGKLGSHITRKHKLDMEDYRLDYPEENLISEELQAGLAKMKCKTLPHWEPFWTAEYALDRLWERYERGLPIYSEAVYREERAGHYMLHKRFGTRNPELGVHDQALRELGLNPEDIRRKPYSLNSKKEVLAAIIKRKKANLPLNVSTVAKRKYYNCPALYNGAIRMFGSWRRAIKAAGLDYSLVRKNMWKYPTQEKLLAEILRRRKAGLPLNAAALSRDRKNSDGTLYLRARELFGSWKKALETAGLRYEDIANKYKCKFAAREAVIAEIQRRYRAALPLNTGTICEGRKSNGDATLYYWGCEYFGTWKKAIKAAGIRYRDIAVNRTED